MKKYLKNLIGRASKEQSSKNLAEIIIGSYEGICPPYIENQEVGASNLKDKLDRQQRGEPFEWPNILALNKTVAGMVSESKNIVELGGGTGAFANFVTDIHDDINILCSEFDSEAHEWAKLNRSHPNISYVNGPVESDAKFDLLVSIEVIEHVMNYREFLQTCTSLAPKAIFTTPNKNRSKIHATASPPKYYQHVREWTAGEFYWVLKCFYQSVELFAMPDVYKPGCVPISILSSMTPLIAVCYDPYE